VVRRLQRRDPRLQTFMTPLSYRFESIEEAQEYVRLLGEVVDETQTLLREEIAGDVQGSARRSQALALVEYKLTQLREHLGSSGRLLNDLRTLRRMLYGERASQLAASSVSPDDF
jgi:hypothetical protein